MKHTARYTNNTLEESSLKKKANESHRHETEKAEVYGVCAYLQEGKSKKIVLFFQGELFLDPL